MEIRLAKPSEAGAAVAILNKAIAQMDTADGWVGLGVVGQRLSTIASDFDPRSYGFRKLSDLVETVPTLRLVRGKTPTGTLYVERK